jgi:hypothetical protein
MRPIRREPRNSAECDLGKQSMDLDRVEKKVREADFFLEQDD